MSITFAQIPNNGIPDRALPKYAIVGVYVVAVTGGTQPGYSGGTHRKRHEYWDLIEKQIKDKEFHARLLGEDDELLKIVAYIVRVL